jgi:hypothetical protein
MADMQLPRRLPARVSRRAYVTASLAPALAVAALLAGAGSAQAKIIEVGKAETPAVPTCPTSPCLAVSRTTGYQVKVGTKRGLFTVPADGRIVAWQIALGNPNAKQIAFFNKGYGAASAGITVLRQGKRLYSRVLGQSPIVSLAPYFGQTVQFPLQTAIDVKKGNVIALTVPTWAPALTQLLDDESSWRASRGKDDCDDTETQTAQTRLRALTQYRCLYRARLSYTATLITLPKPNKPPKAKKTRR